MYRLALAAAAAIAVTVVTAPAATASVSCHGPASLSKVCVDTTGPCTVGRYFTTPSGSGYQCLVGRPAAARSTGPCATVRNLFDKYNIQIDMHQAEAEAAIRLVCSHTG